MKYLEVDQGDVVQFTRVYNDGTTKNVRAVVTDYGDYRSAILSSLKKRSVMERRTRLHYEINDDGIPSSEEHVVLLTPKITRIRHGLLTIQDKPTGELINETVVKIGTRKQVRGIKWSYE